MGSSALFLQCPFLISIVDFPTHSVILCVRGYFPHYTFLRSRGLGDLCIRRSLALVILASLVWALTLC